MSHEVAIRPYTETDAPAVRALFIAVNRSLAPAHLRDAFEAYMARSLAEEIDRIEDYYRDRRGGFWIATQAGTLAGMLGLETVSDDAMELRRMYVAPSARRRGVARRMLDFAEAECRNRRKTRLVLSTSEVQQEALALYRNSGFRLLREELARDASNKTVGGGIRRYYFEKAVPSGPT